VEDPIQSSGVDDRLISAFAANQRPWIVRHFNEALLGHESEFARQASEDAIVRNLGGESKLEAPKCTPP
jgi:hypothetical protein